VNTDPTSHKDDNLGDSDDEEEGPNTIGPEHELMETAITLLVSVLEGIFSHFRLAGDSKSFDS